MDLGVIVGKGVIVDANVAIALGVGPLVAVTTGNGDASLTGAGIGVKFGAGAQASRVRAIKIIKVGFMFDVLPKRVLVMTLATSLQNSEFPHAGIISPQNLRAKRGKPRTASQR